MNILALDIATKTGWATKESSGVWNLKAKKGESLGMRLIYLKSNISKIVEEYNINLIVYERPAGRFKSSIITASEMIGIVTAYCLENNIEYAAYSASEIKKFATGKGNSNKDAMIKSAEEHFNMKIIDDNHADALWLLELANSNLNV